MKLCAGIDLHSNNSTVAIIDEQDRVMFQKKFPNDLERILFATGELQAVAGWSGCGVDLQAGR